MGSGGECPYILTPNQAIRFLIGKFYGLACLPCRGEPPIPNMNENLSGYQCLSEW
jgi:hypothetical protein